MANGTLRNSLVVDNVAAYGGGVLYATLNNCTVINNFAGSAGGSEDRRFKGGRFEDAGLQVIAIARDSSTYTKQFAMFHGGLSPVRMRGANGQSCE